MSEDAIATLHLAWQKHSDFLPGTQVLREEWSD
jgi:hypothetical protein